MRTRVAAALPLALACACTPPVRSAPAPAGGVSVALVDSIAFETEMHDGVLHPVLSVTMAPREKPSRSTGRTVAEGDSSVGALESAGVEKSSGRLLRMTPIPVLRVFLDWVMKMDLP